MPEFNPPEAERILVLAPHPDDEALGCGGTITLYSQMGKHIQTVFLSDGEGLEKETPPERISRIRKNEAIEAASVLKTKEPLFLGYPDGNLREHEHRIFLDLMEIVEEVKPDIIFSPSPLDHHPDHLTTALISERINKRVQALRLAYYEVYNTIRFNTVIDISNVIDTKEKALLKYRYSLFENPELFFYSIRSLNAYRSFYTQKKGFFEAFWLVDSSMSKEEILKWLTYDQYGLDPAERLFLQMKGMDEILFELYNCHADLRYGRKRQTEIEKHLFEKERILQEQTVFLKNLQTSIPWRIISRFYRVRDILLPAGSGRRKVYDSIIRLIKK